ncbi:hypothetical protein K1719_032676 [Acacia pycnantha]|nr:hypothetical protein K1719_032676 [Acacia pycnantha]
MDYVTTYGAQTESKRSFDEVYLSALLHMSHTFYLTCADSIPSINSTSLNILNLSSNDLSGSSPISLRKWTVMDLSKNILEDDVSVMRNREATFEVLDMSSNRLSGSFPNLTNQFEGLTIFALRNNSTVGTFPPNLGTYSKLSMVDSNLNELNGPIPVSLFISTTLTSLNLFGNHFTGSIPLENSGMPNI